MKTIAFLLFSLLSFLITNLLSLIAFMVLKFDILVFMRIFGYFRDTQSNILYFTLFALIFIYFVYKIYAKIFLNKNVIDKYFSYFLITSYFFILHAILSSLMFSFGLKKDLSDLLLLSLSSAVVVVLSIYGAWALNKFVDKKFIKFLSKFLDK